MVMRLTFNHKSLKIRLKKKKREKIEWVLPALKLYGVFSILISKDLDMHKQVKINDKNEQR